MSDPNDSSMQDLKPTVWIGKQGCTETMIGEIVAQLKNRHTIKVKWLQNTEVDPAEIATLAKAELVSVRGKTMVLKEKKGAGKGKPFSKMKNPPVPKPLPPGKNPGFASETDPSSRRGA
jgi:RNA-binding protein